MTSRENQRPVDSRTFFVRGMDQMCSGCSVFGNCDCLSSTYLGISISFFFFGSVMMFNGESDDFLTKFELRPACLIGFTFICTSLAVAIKSLLYLRRKSAVLLLRRHPVLRVSSVDGGPEIREDSPVPEYLARNTSTSTLPPSYDDTLPGMEMGENPSSFAPIDTPPPSYDEAVYLMSLKANTDAETEKPESSESVPISKP